MAEAPRPWYEEEQPASQNTFFGGYTLKEFKALPHFKKLQVMAKHDRKRGVVPVECQSADGLTRWTQFKPKKRRKNG